VRVRHKLLLLLLAVSLMPLIAVSYYGQSNTRRLGREIAERAREALARSASSRLHRIADDFGALLKGERKMIELSVELQAVEIEGLFDREVSVEGAPAVEFSSTFAREGALPADALTTSKRHVRLDEAGGLEPIPLTFESANVLLAPGVEKQAVGGRLARLPACSSVLRRIGEDNEHLFLWQYVSFDDGVHFAYPGHGGYPEEYDPRLRIWYEGARESETVFWTPPMVDVTTRQVLVTCSAPISDPEGQFLGVTGIDIRIVDILDQIRLPEGFSSEARAMLVTPREREDGLGTELYAVAAYDETGAWDVPLSMERLYLDAWTFRKMTADLEARVSGVVRMPYRGRESLWAYGPIDSDRLNVVIVVPWDLAVAEAVEMEQHVLDRTAEHLATTAGIFLAVALIVVVAASRIARSVTRPIRRLTAVARSIAHGDLNVRTSVHTGDEFQDLSDSFEEMLPYLRERLQIRQELHLAKEVQQNLLPREAPTVSGLDVAGVSIYCDETGGDYYDYFLPAVRGKGRFAVAVGDVAGHGVGPALLMTTARALLRTRIRDHRDLSEICGLVNLDLVHDANGGRFMTLFLLEVDQPGQLIRWVCAGHDRALLFDPAEESLVELGGEDIALGIEEGWKYREHSRGGFAGGELILIGTDGIPETRNRAGRIFGAPALRDLIRENADLPAARIVDAVTSAIADFRGPRAQEDDTTLVVIKILPEGVA
jgi:phosphoserine phosphatase RsbU/P